MKKIIGILVIIVIIVGAINLFKTRKNQVDRSKKY